MRDFISDKYLVTVTIACVSIMLLPIHYREALYLDLDFANQGQYWRYITGHFTHHSWIHCISNLVGLYLIYGIFLQGNAKLRWALPSVFIICFISLGLTISSESLKWYIGYSGVLVGLLSYTSVITFGQNALLSFAFLLTTTTYVAAQTIIGGELVQAEFMTSMSTSSYAHMYGLFAGFIYGVTESLRHLTLKFD